MQEAFVFLHLPKTGGTTLNAHFDKVCLKPGHFVHLPDPAWMALPKTEKNRAQVIAGHGAYYGVHQELDKTCRYFTVLRDPFERFVSGYFYMKKIEADFDYASLESYFKRWVIDRHDPIGEYRDRNEMLRFLAKMTRGPFWRWMYTHSWGLRVIRVVRRFARSAFPTGLYSWSLKLTDQIWLWRSKRFLDRCWFVGVVEHSDQDFPELLRAMGLPENYQNQNEGQERTTSRRKRYAEDPRFRDLYVAFRKANAADYALYAYAMKVRARHYAART